MQVRVLGPIEVHGRDGQFAISANQRRLVALLAAHPGAIVPAGTLADRLWPDEPPRHPHSALQNVVSRLRARLDSGASQALLTRPPGYGLALDHVTLDHLEFERALADARTADDITSAIERYDEALEWWRGDAYAEFVDLDGVRDDAVRLDELRSVAREERLGLLVRVDPRAALPELEAMVSAQPYRERGHMLLMEALYRNQRQRDALAAFHRYRVMLADELGLVPSPAIRQLESAILTDALPVGPDADQRTEHPDVHFPSPDGKPSRGSSGPSVAGNITERRTSFVGRTADVDAVAELLRDHRLVSLVGVGGAGKTTLATEVARRVAPDFEDGAWIVDLVGLPPGGRIADHIAGSIGLGRLPVEHPADALARELDHRDLLLVLDNCEHLVNYVASVVDRLLVVPGRLRVLATSRESLRIPGELVRPVVPLVLPPEGADRSELLASASGRLFVDRVLDIDPSLVLEEEDAPVIAGICRRLDGLPLAIELAAARLPTLGLRSLAARLDDRFRLLSSHHRTAVEHHQTLRAAIDWSVDLLDEPQLRLFARLGVFVGDFDLEAAEYVCADDDLDSTAVADTLSRLVDRSLVVRRRDDAAVRYRLLETIRAHATSLLDEAELDAVRHRHREWYCRLAHAVGERFLVETTVWYGRLRAAFPNIRSAFDWSMRRGDVAAALDITTALHWAPLNTGHLYRELQWWVEQSLDAARVTSVDPHLLGRGLVTAGALATLESRSESAIDMLTEAIGLFASSEELDRERVWSQMWLAAALADCGRHREAVETSDVALQLARSIGYDTGVVYLAAQHAETAVSAALLTGDVAARELAIASFELAVETAERLGAEEGLVRAQHGRALFDAVVDDPGVALGRCEAALDEWRRLGAGNRLILGLVATARVAVLAGRLDVAATLTVEALDTMDRVGWRQALRRALEVAAILAVERRAANDAALLIGAASARFATPRWHVPLAPAEELAFQTSLDSVDAWADHVEVGCGLTDAAAAAVARRVATGFLER